MSRGLGFVQASILRYMSDHELHEHDLHTARELCGVVYEHEDGDIARHLPAVRRALYGLEELGLVECTKFVERESRAGAPSRLWSMTSAGYERAERGLVINIPRHDRRDREVEELHDAMVAFIREREEAHVREVMERVLGESGEQ